jgi:hypothetical protein
MAMKKTRQTFAKREREQLVKEKRDKKQLKKRQAALPGEDVDPASDAERPPE